MPDESDPTEFTRAQIVQGRIIGGGLMLLLAIPVFWAFSWLAWTIGFFALDHFATSDEQFLEILPWVRGFSFAFGIYMCWVLYAIMAKRNASHAA